MTDIKRLNYFTSQFLVEKDFKDEQAYQMGMRRQLNLSFHGWGVANGMTVAKSGDKEVTVDPGLAIDKDGREIVLLEKQVINLSTFAANETVYLTIAYQEIKDPSDHYTTGGVDNYTRTTERPDLKAVKGLPASDGTLVILAKVQMNKDGKIDTVDPSIRKCASSVIDPASKLQIGNLSVSGNAKIGTSATEVNLEVTGGALLGYETLLPDFNASLKSGFYQANGQQFAGDVPDQTYPWKHLITARHNNINNNHQLQIASSYVSNDRLFFRKIRDNNPAWNEVATRGANTFSGQQTIKGNLSIDGSVGIGVANPTDAHLHIGGTISQARVRLDNQNGQQAWLNRWTDRLEILATDQIKFAIGNIADDKLIIQSNGNLIVKGNLQILNTEQDANGNTLVLGPTSSSNLRLGYNTEYSWIQSHAQKPLVLNPLGNPVRIGGNALEIKDGNLFANGMPFMAIVGISQSIIQKPPIGSIEQMKWGQKTDKACNIEGSGFKVTFYLA